MATPLMITCTRCNSMVPWGPYCPECSAYLEFAGDPPWNPKGSPPPEDEEFDESEQAEIAVADSPDEEVTIDEVVEVPEEFAELFRPEEAPVAPRITARNVTEVVGIALFGVVIIILVSQLANWVVAGALGVFVAGWCALLIASWFSARQPTVVDSMVIAVAEEVEVDVTEILEEPVVVSEAPLVLEARAPQELPSQVVERTVASATRTVHGDTPCPACGQLNEATRIFCDWCGAAMPGAVLQPAIVTMVAAEDGAVRPEPASPPRRLTRSWRTPIIVFSLLGVFLSAVIFALFGPNAFRVQFGLTQVYQSINQFINPTAGTLITPVDVVASSTLEGTLPISASGGDGRTFWASASSFGFSAGTTLTFFLGREVVIDRMIILPGVQGSQFSPRALATPKDIKLTFMDGSTFETQLLGVQADRDFRQLVEFPRTRTDVVTMEIVTVYPPSGESLESFGEVAISGVEFIAPPAPPQFLRLPTEMPAPQNLPGS